MNIQVTSTNDESRLIEYQMVGLSADWIDRAWQITDNAVLIDCEISGRPILQFFRHDSDGNVIFQGTMQFDTFANALDLIDDANAADWCSPTELRCTTELATLLALNTCAERPLSKPE